MWVYSPKKQPRPKVPDTVKVEVKTKADKIVEKLFLLLFKIPLSQFQCHIAVF